MPTVVIIHAAEDSMPARALAEKLRQAKLTVVMDKPPGDELRAAVKSAPVSIALWSPRSVSQAPLVDEVKLARGKSTIVHACMQSAPPPEQFRSDRAVNLTGWRGEDDFPPWRDLAKLVTDKAGVAPLPPPAPRPPSGFFQPGRPVEAATAQQGASRQAQPPRPAQSQPQRQAAPAPRAAPPTPRQAAPAPRPAPRQAAPPRDEEPAKRGGGLVIGLVALAAVAVLGGGGYYFWNQSQSAESTSAAWESVERNDAAALRAFIAGDPGDFRDDAETALAELEERTFEAASDADTIESLETFLNDFPESEHAIAARGRIAELRSLPQPPTTAPDLAPVEGAPDPDLVPPNSAPTGGPAPLTPPPTSPTPAPAPTTPPPADLPIN